MTSFFHQIKAQRSSDHKTQNLVIVQMGGGRNKMSALNSLVSDIVHNLRIIVMYNKYEFGRTLNF